MQIRLEGRAALVTGGSRGMGAAMAKKFAESGADVAIAARRPDVLEKTKAEIEAVAEGKVLVCPCDMNEPDQIKSAFDSAVREFGKVDILVNNAGTSIRGKFEEVTDEMWNEDLGVKLWGVIRMCRLAFPPMKERRWGRILNVVTVGGKAPRAGNAPTAISRAAGIAMTKVLAGEGAPYNVLVNALCTGRIITDQTTRGHQRTAPDIPWEEYLKMRGEEIPLGRLGTAEEYANMACFLASDAASYITGAAINIDGNLSPVV